MRALLAAGALLMAPDRHGWAPLHRAAMRGREAAAIALLEHGADPEACRAAPAGLTRARALVLASLVPGLDWLRPSRYVPRADA